MNSNIKLSIIIVNYKVKEHLFNCLRSIYDSKPLVKFEVIVVNNDEQETLQKDLLKKFPKAIYIKSKKNLGYGGGNNLGVKKAKGEYLFFLNPDTIVFRDAIDKLFGFLSKNKKTGIVAPILLNKKNQPYKLQGTSELTPLRGIVVFSFLNKIFPKIFNQYWFTNWNKIKPQEVYSIPGTAFLIKKNIFNSIGKFDENFFLYFEENDLSRRIKKKGYSIFIIPNAKIYHIWGESTKNIKDLRKIFIHSRYLYFEKHYGIIKALLVEAFLRMDKYKFYIIFLMLLALFLRLNNLYNGMAFIGDQAWFYLSARDLITSGKVPLIGITSSHIWLHQGPLWTYILSIVLFIFKFNPLAGGYLTAFLGSITTLLIYKISSVIFSKKVGIISAAFFAVSPLVIMFDRMPFDPSPIPFFTLLYFFSFYKWVKGNITYFPIIIFFLATLYNLELATFTLFFPFAALVLIGTVQKRKWAIKIFNWKTLLLSILSFVIPMAPVLIYDFFNGFKQTLVFFAWTIYKPFSILLSHTSTASSHKGNEMIYFFSMNLEKLIFEQNLIIAVLIFFSSIIFLSYSAKKIKFKIENPYTLLFFILFFVLAGVLINQTPSGAYLPIAFPFIFISIGIFLNFILSIKKLKFSFTLLISIILLVNLFSSFRNDYGTEFKARLDAVSKVIALTKNQEYNLIGIGIGSQFNTLTANYEYLLWWKGHAPSKISKHLKIFISEDNNKITVTKKYD